MKTQTFIKIATLTITVSIATFGNYDATAQSQHEPSSRGTNERQRNDTRGQGVDECITRFDRFRNRNTITIEPRTILRTGTDELKLGASAISEGDNNNTAPREIDLLFDSTTNRLRYGNSAEVRFIVDGRRMEGGAAYKFGGSAMRQVNEKLRLTMPASRFLEIIKGRVVEMQLGETEVRLRREDLDRLRNFASCAGLRTE